MKIQLDTFCEFFYASHYIPISILRGGEVVRTYSSMDKPLPIFHAVLPQVTASQKNPDFFSLPEQGQYGLVHLNARDEGILVGPVFSSAVSEDVALAVARGNFIAAADMPALTAFLSAIPQCPYNQFLSLLAYLHYSLNRETFDVMGHFHAGIVGYDQTIATTHTEVLFTAKEQQKQHGTYNFENLLLSYVRDGEVDKLNRFLLEAVKTEDLSEGTLADTPLRQAKNLLIGSVTMIGKIGAIGGGMDVEEAYRLIDVYIQECEKAPTVDAVKLLQYNMVLDFTERVSLSKLPQNTSKEIFVCMQYIQNHTNDTIGIDDLVAFTGKSRAYLTKKFRSQTGLSIGECITQSKLRDAKRLLRYSDKTLSDISNYLCFSSQAYFQTVFKQEVGMTPNAYRQKHNFWDKG